MEFLRASNLVVSFNPDIESFDADGHLPCNVDDREVTIIDDDVAVLDDGRLIMFGQENRLADDHKWLFFESTDYCIDRVSLSDNLNVSVKSGGSKMKNKRSIATTSSTANTTTMVTPSTYAYVALVCRPCSRIKCVPKCCAKGFVLEYLRGKLTGCRKAQSVTDANSAIHLRTANGTELHCKYDKVRRVNEKK